MADPVSVRVDTFGTGKADDDKISEIVRAKPAAAKGRYIKAITLTTTMGPGIRVDSHAYSGYTVPPNYDSLIGKIIAYGDTRAQAIARLSIALSETVIEVVDPLAIAAPSTSEFCGSNKRRSAITLS